MSPDEPADAGNTAEKRSRPETLGTNAPVGARTVNSAALLAGHSQLAILHNQTVYFLRQTRFGKLILTK